MDIVELKTGNTLFLKGNEAIVRGAIESGIDVVTNYPGTPSTGISDTFSAIAKYFKKQGKEKPRFLF